MAPSTTRGESGTTALTGLKCFAITCVTETVFAVLTGWSGDAVTGFTFPAGLTIWGNFSALTLTSGTIIIYEA